MFIVRFLKQSSIAALLLGGLTGAATADPFWSEDTGVWRHSGIVYGFLPIESQGVSTVGGVSANVDLSLKDVFDILDMAGAGRFESWNGRFGAIVDFNYFAIGADADGPNGFVNVEADNRLGWLSLMGAYQAAEGTYGNAGNRYSVDVAGGVRYTYLKNTITGTQINATPNFPAGTRRTLGGDASWFEPVVSARGRWELNDKWDASLIVDAGGFGVGGNDLAYSATALLTWKAWERSSLVMGWRYYSIDFSEERADGTFAYDMTQTGPLIGLAFTF